MATLGCYLLPQGKYTRFVASTYVDEDVKADLVLDIRKDTFNGPVLKSYTLVPGETVNIEADITGVSKLYITTEVKTNHETVNKFIIGEPVFMN